MVKLCIDKILRNEALIEQARLLDDDALRELLIGLEDAMRKLRREVEELSALYRWRMDEKYRVKRT